MTYYQLTIHKENNKIVIGSIKEEKYTEKIFESINWDEPVIIKENINSILYTALDKDYLLCILTAISKYKAFSES